METDRVGTRIASLRTMRGITQRKLAQEAHISYSLLTKIESGHAPATPAVIGTLARALRVDIPRLTGQPYENTGTGRSGRLKGTIDPLRRAIAAMDYPAAETVPRAVEQLAPDVAHVSALGQKADYVGLAASLPTLLEELGIAVAAAPDADKPRLNALLAEAYSGATSIAGLLGYLDLRDRVVDRIEQASQASDDPLRVPRVAWQRSWSLMGMGSYSSALILMSRSRAQMGDDPTRMSTVARSVYGSLHLRSAVIAARAAKSEGPGRAQLAWEHIDAAREVANLSGADRNDYGLAFGPSNVNQHAVAIAVELEDGATAIDLGHRLKLGVSTPPVRRSHHHIDLARAYYMHGDHRSALHALHTARRIAPQQTRHHPMVRETILAIASDGRGSEELTSFSSWLGID